MMGMGAASGWSRREFLRRAAAAGVIAVPGAALAGCATSGGGGNKKVGSGKKTGENPLGVKADAPLDVYIFKGGYGDQYAIDTEKMYAKEFKLNYSDDITHTGTQQLAQKLQPKFVSKTPPDVIDNSGDGNLDAATLIKNNQLMDLTPLLDAPSYDDPNTKVRDTILPGVVDLGSFSGKPYILNYGYNVQAIWYSQSLFKDKGWEYPKTWADMMDLCKEIKSSTKMYPWTFQGKFPQYIQAPIFSAATKLGGPDVLKNVDNLKPGAFRDHAMVAAAEAFHSLVEKGYVLPGTSGLTHTQSQARWAQGDAVFIPCGSWLRSELGDVTPDGFDMVVAPTPSLTDSDKLPFATIQASATEGYIVPSDAKNPQGGLEFLRLMLSKQASTNFSNLTHALTVLQGYAGNISDSAVSSANDAAKAAGTNTIYWKFGTWYAEAENAIEDQTGQLMAGKINPDTWSKECQKICDKLRNDSSVKKYER